MGSLDIDSICNYISSGETIEICTKSFLKNNEIAYGLKPKSPILYLIIYYTSKLAE